MVIRCRWATDDEIYIKYHDEEWGIPQYDSLKLFEQICLEGQQAGLSWITVLKKRENYRKAFYQFDPYKIIHIDSQEINIMLENKGLIRHKSKLEAIVKNANAYIQMEKSGENFSDFIWSFVNHQPQINDIQTTDHRPTQTEISKKMSQQLKKRGFVFVGETICYAFMQSMGLVNDHVNSCFFKYGKSHSI